MPMRPMSPAGSEHPDLPLSAFVFIGSNITYKEAGVKRKNYTIHVLRLEEIPKSRYLQPQDSGSGLEWPFRVSALICDPRLQITPAMVTLLRGSLHAIAQPDFPVVGNIPPSTANLIFSEALIGATSSEDQNTLLPGNFINNIARNLFLKDPTLSKSFNQSSGRVELKLLPISQINENMNVVMRSAAKSYLSGHKPNAKNTLLSISEAVATEGWVDIEELAMVGSRPFSITVLVLVSILAVLLTSLIVILRVDQMQPFDLGNVAKVASKVHIQ